MAIIKCNSCFCFTGITTDVWKEGKVDEALTTRLLNILKDKFQVYHMIQILSDLFKKCDKTKLVHVDSGSVKFIVNVKSREGLDKLWDMFTKGELAKKLTEILITDELTTEDKSNIAIKVTMTENDYEEGCRFFEDKEKGK